MASFGMLQGVRAFSSSSRSLGKLVSTPISVHGTEGRYASAVFSAATKEKKLEAVEKDLKNVRKWLATDKKFSEYVLDPSQRKTQKIRVLSETLTNQGCTTVIINLLASLIENGRLRKLHGVIGLFEKLMSAQRGQVVAKVTTAKPLDATSAKELEASLQGFLVKGQTLLLSVDTDPSIVGGMVVSIGDKYIDMSMSSKIKAYNNLIRLTV